jgi:hypothetical protein
LLFGLSLKSKGGKIMGKEKEVCSWCGKELHDNGETTWCDCGWWDALPTRAEAEAETK